MIAQIQLFGSFAVTVDDKPVQFSTRPTESLCAYLACRQRPELRIAVAEAIWPEIEIEKATNRLRTALVHVKQALSPWAPIEADRQKIGLSLKEASCDLTEAERLYRRSRIAQDVEDERDTLQKLLALIDKDLLEDWREPWAEELRLYWRERKIETALRLAGIGIGLEEYELGESESLRALSADEYNEEAWSAYLRSMMELGRQAPAVERFRAARKRRQAELGFDFSSDLLQLAKRVSSGTPKPERSRFSAEARDVLSSALERTDPTLLLPVLASDAFRKEALRKPFESWKLLCDVIERTEGTDELRVKVMRFCIFLAGMVDQYGVGCDYAEWIIENLPETNSQHRQAVNMLGFMSFEIRDWDDAWRNLYRYREMAEKYGQPGEVAVAKSQIASLKWHTGEVEQALEEYLAQDEIMAREEETLGNLYNLSVLRANTGTVYTILGRWAEARRIFEQTYSMAVSNGFDYVRAGMTAQLGLSMIITGNKTEGRKMAAIGLAHTYRSRYRRMHQVSADYAAAALAASGYVRQGLAVLDAYTDFRAEAHHARSTAEETFVNWIRAEFGGAGQGKQMESGEKPAEIVASSCDILESN